MTDWETGSSVGAQTPPEGYHTGEDAKEPSLEILTAGRLHDARNRFCAAIGFTELAYTRATDPKSKELLKIALDCAQDAESLLCELTQALRGTYRAAKLCSLDEAVDDSYKILKGHLAQTGHILEACLASRAIIKTPKNEVRRIVENLVYNARDASPKESTITISTRKTEEYGMLEVTDHGCGIHPENMKKIFDPYFTTKEHGTGIGLSVVKSIIESRNGMLTVRSENGTTIEAYLPLK